MRINRKWWIVYRLHLQHNILKHPLTHTITFRIAEAALNVKVINNAPDHENSSWIIFVKSVKSPFLNPGLEIRNCINWHIDRFSTLLGIQLRFRVGITKLLDLSGGEIVDFLYKNKDEWAPDWRGGVAAIAGCYLSEGWHSNCFYNLAQAKCSYGR